MFNVTSEGDIGCFRLHAMSNFDIFVAREHLNELFVDCKRWVVMPTKYEVLTADFPVPVGPMTLNRHIG